MGWQWHIKIFQLTIKLELLFWEWKMVLEGVRGCEAQAAGWAPVGMGRRVVRLLVAESSAGESPSFIKLFGTIIKLQSGSYQSDNY